MFQNPANEKKRQIAEPGVTISGEERFIAVPKRYVSVHAGAVIGEGGLRHEGHGLVVPLGDVAQDIFVILHVIAHAFEWRETDIDFGLAGRRDLVMLAFNWDAGALELKTHFVANVLLTVHRRDGKITFFRANFVPEVWEFFSGAVPVPFATFDLMK